MAKNHLICGLDIGTQNIKILIVNKKNEKELEILSQIQDNSIGVRKGVVVSPEEVSNVLQELFTKIKEDSGSKIDSVYVNINGSHLFATPSRGSVSVSRADQKISEEDIQRVLQAAQTFSLSLNKEIFNVFPKEFIVDGQGEIKEALGLQGVRLEVEVLALGGFSPYLKNLTQAVLGSELQILDMTPSPIAAARACLTKKQKELGAAILDIGAGTSGLAVFEEGDLIHLVILPIGSANITNDIAIGLKTDIEVAERIKIEYGSCLLKGKDKREKIEVGEEEPLIFSHKFLTKIIEARVSEIFGEVNKELKKISREKLLPAGIVLTGGGTKLPKIIDLAKRELKLPSRLGKPKEIGGIEDDMALATVCGLVLLGSDLEGETKNSSFSGEGVGSKLKKMFKIFIP